MSSPISPHPKTRQGKRIIQTVAQLKLKKTLSSSGVSASQSSHGTPKKCIFRKNKKKTKKKMKAGEMRAEEASGRLPGKGWISREGLDFLGKGLISPESILCS